MDKSTRLKERLKLVLVLLIILITYWTKAQVFNEPEVNASTTDGQVMIRRIEITDDQTIFTLWVRPHSGNSVYFSSKTYIVPSSGGKKLFIARVKDIPLDQLYHAEESDEPTEYILYFPKTDHGVQYLNFRSGEDGNYWHFFDINVKTNIAVDASVKSGKKGMESGCKFITEPGYTAKSGGFHVRRIDICKNETILHFEVNIYKGSWIFIPSKSSIRNSNGGEDLFVTKAEGTNIDEKVTTDAKSGEILSYKLYFPPIDPSVKKIDFREVLKGGTWFVYELDTDVSDVK